MDDETAARRARQAKELDELRALREESRERVGVDPEMLEKVVAEAMARAGASLEAARAGEINGVALFRLDPNDPAFVGRGWAEALDDLRIRRRKRSEKLKDWRADAPLRAVSFRPALTADGVDAEGVLQLHLEHRLVRRLLSRFLSQGFASGLSRASVVIGPGAQPRVVLLGRLALYGPGAARLHEEILLVTAAWTESGPDRPVEAVRRGAGGRDARTARPGVPRPALARSADHRPDPPLGRARRRGSRAGTAAAGRGAQGRGDDANSPPSATPRPRRSAASSKTSGHASPRPTPSPTTRSSSLFDDAEAEQRRRDRRRWKAKLEKLTKDIAARAAARPGGLRRRRRPSGDDRPRLSLAGGQLIMAGIDPNDEWLGHVQPVGLVVAPIVLARYGLDARNPDPRRHRGGAGVHRRSPTTAARRAQTRARCRTLGPSSPALLGWRAAQVAGAPGGPALPEDLFLKVEESDTEIAPDWAVADPDGGWQILVRIEPPGVKPDERGALAGWEATPHQRFERLLREKQIPIGLLITDDELRLIYAPRGETSGWLTFPLRSLAEVGGRPMLGGLKLLLSSFRLHNDAPERRLPALLKASREAQAEVSTRARRAGARRAARTPARPARRRPGAHRTARARRAGASLRRPARRPAAARVPALRRGSRSHPVAHRRRGAGLLRAGLRRPVALCAAARRSRAASRHDGRAARRLGAAARRCSAWSITATARGTGFAAAAASCSTRRSIRSCKGRSGQATRPRRRRCRTAASCASSTR